MITAIVFGKKVQVLDTFEYESGYKEFIVRDLEPGEFGEDVVYIVDKASLHEVKQHGGDCTCRPRPDNDYAALCPTCQEYEAGNPIPY